MNQHPFQACIDACYRCATACHHCAAQCLAEDDVKMMAACIKLDLQCAIVCQAVAQLLSLQGPHAKLLCQACADICDACAAECEQHAAHGMEHCAACAAACRNCAAECRALAT